MAKKITFDDKSHILPYGEREVQVWDLDINEIKAVVNANADQLEGLEGGYQGVLMISDTPTEDGYYMAGESGTYVNAGNVVVDLTQGITFINVSETQTVFTTTLIPIETYPPNTGEFDPTDNVYPATQKCIADVLVDKADLVDGKNMFYINEVLTGYYYKYNTGVLTANATFSAFLIKVDPNTSYTWSNGGGASNLQQFAWYDADMNYIDGSTGGDPTIVINTDSNTHYIGVNVSNSYLDYLYQFELGDVATSFKPAQKVISNDNLDNNTIQNEKILDETLDETKVNPNSNITVKKVGKNLFDINDLTSGGYVKASDGQISVNASYSYTDYIAIEPNTDYTWSDFGGFNLQQFAWYDSDKVYIDGDVGSANPITFNSGANGAFVRLTLQNTQLTELYQLEQGTSQTDYNEYSISVKITDIESYKATPNFFTQPLRNQLKAKQTVYLSDYTNLRECIESITDASILNPYEVLINEGTYDIMSYYSESEINDTLFKGLDILDGITLVGVGLNSNVILQGYLDDLIYDTITINRVSTLNFIYNGGLENLTVTAENLRYAVHDDISSSGLNATRLVKNIIATKIGVNGFTQSYGAGCRSGADYTFSNSYFHTDDEGAAFSMHNNTGFTKKAKMHIENNTFQAVQGYNAIAFGSLQSTTDDEIIMIGNNLSGGIRLYEESTGSGDGIQWKLKGYGNTKVPVYIETTIQPNQYTYNFNEDCQYQRNRNGTTLLQGEAVYLNYSGSGGVVRMTSSTSNNLFYGIVYEDIAAGESGLIRIGNFIEISKTNLTGLTIGDRIGVVSGALVVVTDESYIGTVILNDYILLR